MRLGHDYETKDGVKYSKHEKSVELYSAYIVMREAFCFCSLHVDNSCERCKTAKELFNEAEEILNAIP